MQYREFRGLEFRPSALGFGAMRLPVIGGDESRIDHEAATEMLRHAVDNGVNYVDTAYVYHGGTCEEWLGQALRDGYRGRVQLATKMPVWKAERAADFDRLLDEQLERLQTPTIDFYLLHSLHRRSWERARGMGVLGWAEGALADGRIGHFGFSFHDEVDVFEEIVAASDLWSFCQIQLNYMDVEHQAGLRGLRYAAARGLGVIVMEPLRGGRLAKTPPPLVQSLWDAAPVRRDPVEWALQWVWDQPEVSLLLSGMSTMEQVRRNVEYAERSGVGRLTAEELAVIDAVRDAYRELTAVDCTGCRYCSPCPNGVDIAAVLQTYNDAFIYDEVERERVSYSYMSAEVRGDNCTACGECEDRCPQGLAVAEWVQRADELLAPRQGET
jgi:predicted aldo/keto reductase-like oxidoreductase